MDESRRFGRSGPPAVETPCFHGTRRPPVLHAGRRAGRGNAAGHPRPPYDPSATAAQIALRALPSRLGRARTRSRFDETGRDGELRPCRAGRGAWRARVLTSTEVGVCGVLRTVPLGPIYRFVRCYSLRRFARHRRQPPIASRASASRRRRCDGASHPLFNSEVWF